MQLYSIVNMNCKLAVEKNQVVTGWTLHTINTAFESHDFHVCVSPGKAETLGVVGKQIAIQ